MSARQVKRAVSVYDPPHSDPSPRLERRSSAPDAFVSRCSTSETAAPPLDSAYVRHVLFRTKYLGKIQNKYSFMIPPLSPSIEALFANPDLVPFVRGRTSEDEHDAHNEHDHNVHNSDPDQHQSQQQSTVPAPSTKPGSRKMLKFDSIDEVPETNDDSLYSDDNLYSDDENSPVPQRSKKPTSQAQATSKAGKSLPLATVTNTQANATRSASEPQSSKSARDGMTQAPAQSATTASQRPPQALPKDKPQLVEQASRPLMFKGPGGAMLKRDSSTLFGFGESTSSLATLRPADTSTATLFSPPPSATPMQPSESSTQPFTRKISGVMGFLDADDDDDYVRVVHTESEAEVSRSNTIFQRPQGQQGTQESPQISLMPPNQPGALSRAVHPAVATLWLEPDVMEAASSLESLTDDNLSNEGTPSQIRRALTKRKSDRRKKIEELAQQTSRTSMWGEGASKSVTPAVSVAGSSAQLNVKGVSQQEDSRHSANVDTAFTKDLKSKFLFLRHSEDEETDDGPSMVRRTSNGQKLAQTARSGSSNHLIAPPHTSQPAGVIGIEFEALHAKARAHGALSAPKEIKEQLRKASKRGSQPIFKIVHLGTDHNTEA